MASETGLARGRDRCRARAHGAGAERPDSAAAAGTAFGRRQGQEGREAGRRGCSRECRAGRHPSAERARDGTMKKVLMSAALVWVGAAVLWAQAGSTSRPQSTTAPRASSPAPAQPQSTPARTQAPAKPAAPTAPAAAPDQTVKYQAWIKQYCINCHNSRTASPANEPVNLETASLTDLVP